MARDRSLEDVADALAGRRGLEDLGSAMSSALAGVAAHDGWALFAFDPLVGVRVDGAAAHALTGVPARVLVRNEQDGADKIPFTE